MGPESQAALWPDTLARERKPFAVWPGYDIYRRLHPLRYAAIGLRARLGRERARPNVQ